jgi:hypothetical protein
MKHKEKSVYKKKDRKKVRSVIIRGIQINPEGVGKAYSLTHGAQPFLRSCQLCSQSRTSQHFMELGGSLPCSQEPSTGPYPEPDQSNPYHSLRSFIQGIRPCPRLLKYKFVIRSYCVWRNSALCFMLVIFPCRKTLLKQEHLQLIPNIQI